MTTTKKKRKPRSVSTDAGRSPSKATKKKTTKKKATKKKRTTKRKSSKSKSSKARPKASDYLKQLRAMSGVTKEDFAMFSEEIVSSPILEFVSTGSIAIDQQIGGGWPIGRISELASWEGVGKSTLTDMSISHVQAQGGIGCLIDSEKARNPKYTERLGVNLDELISVEVDTLEQGFTQIERMINVQRAMKKKHDPPPPMLIIWDSLGGTPSKAELAGASDDKHVGSAARVIKQNFRRLTQQIAELRIAFVACNHFYEKIGGFGGLVSYGGSGIRYFSTVRLWLTRTGQVKISNRVVGHTVKAKLKKTRVRTPVEPIETALIYGSGFDNSYSLFEWAKKSVNPDGVPWIQQNVAHYWLYPPGEEPIHFQRQFIGLAEILNERPDIYRMMVEQFMKQE